MAGVALATAAALVGAPFLRRVAEPGPRRSVPRPGAARDPGIGMSGPTGKVAEPCPRGRPWAPAGDSPPPRPSPPASARASDVERIGDELTNGHRREGGLAELLHEATLRDVARAHSEHMFRDGFFSHDAPDGRAPSDRVHAGHRRLVGEAGENIWKCTNCWNADPHAVAEQMLAGWMDSPGHRRNILRESFTHGAIGVSRHGDDVWATQVFAKTRGWLFDDLPPDVEPRGCLLLEVDPYPASATRPVRFDLLSLSSREPVIDPSPLGFMRIDAPRGSYRLRFYFPRGPRRYGIVSGPTVAVR